MAVCLVWLTYAGFACGQEASAPPYTGEYTTLNRTVAAGPAVAMPVAEAQARVGAACAACGPTNYLDMQMLVFKATGPRNKFDLFSLNELSPAVQTLDTYRAGTFGTNPSAGVKVMWGKRLDAESAWEVGVLWLSNYFYKREYTGVTTSSTFGGTTSTQVIFDPTGAAIDHEKVDYRLRNFGLENNLRWRRCPGNEVILGWRYHCLTERFNYDYTPSGAKAALNESFNTSNDLLGVQLGFERSRALGDYAYLKAYAKGTLGPNLQGVRIAGPAAGSGLLTNDSNLGYDDRFRLGTLLDFGVAAVGQLTPHIEASVGLGGMYFGGIARGANYMDPKNAGGSPVRRWTDDALLLYGLNFAVKIDY